MRAIVLSGGGNFGAMQVGALEALYEAGIEADLYVGVSAGALNAAWMAFNPGLEGIHSLARVWSDVAPRIYSGIPWMEAAVRLVTGRKSMLDNRKLIKTIQRFVPAEACISTRHSPSLLMLATRLFDGEIRVFGEQPEDRLLDGLMASTALPPLLPPWEVDGQDYVDGGASTNLPVLAAIRNGATEIYALQCCSKPEDETDYFNQHAAAICLHTVSLMVNKLTDEEISCVDRYPHINLHLIKLVSNNATGFWDFNHARELIHDGRISTRRYMETLRFESVPSLQISNSLRNIRR